MARTVTAATRFVLGRSAVALLAVAALLAALTTVVLAADPDTGTLTSTSGPVTWTGATSDVTTSTGGTDSCADASACDVFTLTVDLPDGYWDDNDGGVDIVISWGLNSDDFDLYAYAGTTLVGTSGQSATTEESIRLQEPANGTYSLRVDPFLIANSSYDGSVTLAATPAEDGGGGGGGGEPVALEEYFLHGTQQDEVNKQNGTISAFFDQNAPVEGDPEVQQIGSPLGNQDTAGNPNAVSWLAPFSGTLDTTMEIEWYWSTGNAEAVAIGSSAHVRIFADPDLDNGDSGTIIGSGLVQLTMGPVGMPVANFSEIDVSGTVDSTMMIQARPEFSDSGQNNIVSYNSPATPSAFRQAPPAEGVVTPPGVPGLAGGDPQGLAFSATVPADNQRDSSEPIMDTDLDGNMISCGPSGVSSAAEYASYSTDGGDQFHLLGQPPRGQIGSGGGGDCSWDFAPEKVDEDDEFYPFAYTGLGPLTNFTASMSTDGGETIQTSPLSGASIPGVDRQWTVFLNATDVLLSYNQQAPRQVVVQKATDGGIAYGPRSLATPPNPSFPGPMEALPAEFNPTGQENGRVAYFPWNDGPNINFSVSFDEGVTWSTCNIAQSLGDPTLFTTGDHDSDGNIYVAWGEDSTYHVFVSHLTPDRLAACDEEVTQTTMDMPTTNPGWSTPIQVDRNEVRTAVFPWLVASGEPGNVAIAFYGTASDGNPNSGDFRASWDVYVSQSLNFLDDEPTFAQVKATTHPFHYDSICQEGLGCSISGGDRSLADFFAIDHDPARDALVIVYDQGSKAPDDAAGQVATPAVVRQIAGPGHGGTTVAIPDREPVRTSSVDPTGDALANYSTIGVAGPGRTNLAGGDFTAVEVGPEIDLTTGEPVVDGGFTVTMTVDDLSDGALQEAMLQMQAQSLLWILRFVDGYRASAVGLAYNPVQGFTAGYNEYTVDNSECGGAGGGKCLQYPLDVPVDFDVDQESGVIRLSVPRSQLSTLSPEPDPVVGYDKEDRPEEVAAVLGSRMYDATAFSLGNVVSPTQDTQGFLYPLDNTPAFDFRLAAAGPTLAIGDASVAEGSSGTTPLTFPVSLSEAPGDGESVTVTATTSDGSATAGTDYTATTTVVSFGPGETTQDVVVPVSGDTDVEPDETLVVTLTAPMGAGIRDGEATGTIVNDDTEGGGPTLTIADAAVDEGDTGDDPDLVLTVTLSEAPSTGQTVTVDHTTVGDTATEGEDFTAADGTLTFAAGETSRTITVDVISDDLDEADETLTTTLANAQGNDVTITRGVATGTIRDDDLTPVVSVGDASVLEGDTGTTDLMFDVTLSAASGRDVTVTYETRDGTATVADDDYTDNDGQVVIAAGDTEATVTVPVIGDTTTEPDETLTVALTAADGANLGDASGTGIILNDDADGDAPTIVIDDTRVVEGSGADGNQAIFTVVLDPAPGAGETVTVDVATADGTADETDDYAPVSGTLTFTEGVTSRPVTVDIVSDDIDETDETFTVGLSNAQGNDAVLVRDRGTATIEDDDDRPTLSVTDASVTEGDSGTTTLDFVVSLDVRSAREVTVDVATIAGTATSGTDYTPLDDTVTLAPGDVAAAVSVTVDGDTSDEDDETVTLRLSDPTNASIGDGQGVGTIIDDDTTPTPETETETDDPVTPPTDRTERLGGETRFGTAVLASQAQFPEDGSADAVVIARGDDPDGFPDALAGVPFAHQQDAPLLIVEPDRLPAETRNELRRVLRQGGTVHILGGPNAVSPVVEAQIGGLGFSTDRIAGETRIDTAIAIAERLGNPDTLFLTTGFNFPDALAAGTAAAVVDGAVLLTGSETRAAATDAYLARFPGTDVFAVGGPSARPYPEATPVFGLTREETAVAVAEEFFDGPAAVGIARSDRFPDALSGGPLMASLDSPILLTPSGSFASSTEDYVCDNAGAIALAEIFGGPVAIDPALQTIIDDRIRGTGC